MLISEVFSEYFCYLTLDPNTASPNLHLSEDNRKAAYLEEKRVYPEHPERFTDVPQVLCREPLTGRRYWEAEWSGETDISVTYKGIQRKGKDEESVSGFNTNSWCLICFEDRLDFWHNHLPINKGPPPESRKRVGVYVDTSAGSMSFYSISDSHVFTHIHTFHSTFTEPLYACFGFLVHPYCSTLSLCQAKNP
ncbi:hypothetical protein DNTS_003543 [Danionella cerebrum]|uniref:B30.2/SPRY domain-containing protein n=1 Tax=Danionella cerebrum TaxID=2873325 RepID=A0A553QXM5_9TELE|nr:hypothetical protein DNTS_003543 [Danionella translucida]